MSKVIRRSLLVMTYLIRLNLIEKIFLSGIVSGKCYFFRFEHNTWEEIVFIVRYRPSDVPNHTFHFYPRNRTLDVIFNRAINS